MEKRNRNVGVYVSNNVFSAWSKYLTAKELAMFMYPTEKEELRYEKGTREDMVILTINMPEWWINWYKSLTKEEKYKFARLVEKRLLQHGLIKNQ